MVKTFLFSENFTYIYIEMWPKPPSIFIFISPPSFFQCVHNPASYHHHWLFLFSSSFTFFSSFKKQTKSSDRCADVRGCEEFYWSIDRLPMAKGTHVSWRHMPFVRRHGFPPELTSQVMHYDYIGHEELPWDTETCGAPWEGSWMLTKNICLRQAGCPWPFCG